MQREFFDTADSTDAPSLLNSTLNASVGSNGTFSNSTLSADAVAAPPQTWLAFFTAKLLQLVGLACLFFAVVVYNLWRNQDKMLYNPQIPGATGVRAAPTVPLHCPPTPSRSLPPAPLPSPPAPRGGQP